MEIDGVHLVDLKVHEDDRGFLFEVLRKTDPFIETTGFAQVYMIGDRTPFTVRAFHRHEKRHDWLCIIRGSALFVLVDDRHEFPPQESDRVVLSGQRPKLLVVPPGIFHGWMSLEPDTLLLCGSSLLYDREAPDDFRVPPDRFNDLLDGSPWEIQHK